MGIFYKIAGILVTVIACAAAYLFNAKVDIAKIDVENQFIASFVHNTTVVAVVNEAKCYFALLIVAVGVCFGLMIYGIGLILSRQRRAV